jgi:hypothetical protein
MPIGKAPRSFTVCDQNEISFGIRTDVVGFSPLHDVRVNKFAFYKKNKDDGKFYSIDNKHRRLG